MLQLITKLTQLVYTKLSKNFLESQLIISYRFYSLYYLPLLTMELFRNKNLNDDNNKIRLLSKRMQNLISKACYRAHTAVYVPYGQNLYYYDINSLYSYCMLKPMPVGSPKRYNIQNGLDKLFGFTLAKVTIPIDLKIPVLPLYIKIKGVEKLIFPTGTFKGYYFSEELKYAKSLGCHIKLIDAWGFQKSYNLFHDYVEPLYELKRTANKEERNVFKLCLNTLYGKWGQHRQYKINIITSDLNLMETIETTFANVKQNTIDGNNASYSFDKAPNPSLMKDNKPCLGKIKLNT